MFFRILPKIQMFYLGWWRHDLKITRNQAQFQILKTKYLSNGVPKLQV